VASHPVADGVPKVPENRRRWVAPGNLEQQEISQKPLMICFPEWISSGIAHEIIPVAFNHDTRHP
jgi:hypothetical protein